MAHQLIHEVYEHAPAELSQAELNVLAVIAYHSQVETRSCWMSSEQLQARARLSATGLRQAMQRLADRGLECRVQQGVTKAGKPVFAYRGRTTTYRLPHFAAPPDGCSCRRHVRANPGNGDAPEHHAAQKADAYTSPMRLEGDAQQRNGDAVTSALTGKGDTGELERRRVGVAQYERTEVLPGGTTDVTTGPRERAGPSAPASPPASPAAPPQSHCGEPGCPAPGPCGRCAAARQSAERKAADREAEQRRARIAAQLRRREEAERPRRPTDTIPARLEVQRILDGRAGARSPAGGRHRLREPRPSPRHRERVPA